MQQFPAIRNSVFHVCVRWSLWCHSPDKAATSVKVRHKWAGHHIFQL